MKSGEGVMTVAQESVFDEKPLQELLAKHRGQRGTMIPLLQGTQAIYGYLPEESLKMIAEALGASECSFRRGHLLLSVPSGTARKECDPSVSWDRVSRLWSFTGKSGTRA